MGFKPTGPYAVGARDLAFCVLPAGAELQPESHVSGRLFYPCKRPAYPSASALPPTCWAGSWASAAGYASFPFAFARGWKARLAQALLQGMVWLLGINMWLPVHWNAELDGDARADVDSAGATQQAGQHGGGSGLPVVLMSHGLGGQRNTYSCICMELASQGYVVCAVEHADGTASLAHIEGGAPLAWPPAKGQSSEDARGRLRWYKGIGDTEAQLRKTDYRLRELRTVLCLMRELTEGREVPGLAITGAHLPGRMLRGRLDTSRVAVVGHSYGGATVGLAVSDYPEFHCGIALDPWWDALPPGCGALSRWRTASPLVILGSHDWNTPDEMTGKMRCNGERQQQLLRAASGGPGALLLVPRGSSHHSYDDILLLWGGAMTPVLSRVFSDFHARLTPQRAQEINCGVILAALRLHLPAPSVAASQGGQQPTDGAAEDADGLPASRTRAAARSGKGASVGEAGGSPPGAGGLPPQALPRPLAESHVELYRTLLGAEAEIVAFSG